MSDEVGMEIPPGSRQRMSWGQVNDSVARYPAGSA